MLLPFIRPLGLFLGPFLICCFANRRHLSNLYVGDVHENLLISVSACDVGYPNDPYSLGPCAQGQAGRSKF